uniref:RCR-type E3 ubiquitin transferase n=8 Tax=Parascaris univalens TaxID=6257 RepID=A0A915ATT0_PARUN
MSYFLRNLNLFAGLASTDTSPNGSPRRAQSKCNKECAEPRATSSQFAQLLRHCAKLPPKGHILRFATIRRPSLLSSTDLEGEQDEVPHRRVVVIGPDGEGANRGFEAASLDIAACLKVVAAPSSFGAAAIARAIVLRYAPLLNMTLPSSASNDLKEVKIPEIEVNIGNCDSDRNQAASNGNQIVALGLKCMFSVLNELNRRDPELCSEALSSLLHLIQHMPAEALSNESYASIQSMHHMLRQLRVEGSAEVSSRATSCMVGLAVAFGMPEFLLSSAASLFCDKVNGEAESSAAQFITIPSNHHKLANLVQRIVARRSDDPGVVGDWWTHCLSEHSVLSAFDARIPNDISPETPDDRRLTGAIASDGSYVYILNCYGLFKYGTGLADTIAGKRYASNTMLKANKGSWLAMCNGSLYLRRRQSSRMWVIDVDTLREIGEIMLHTSAIVGTLITDGYAFYQANIDEQWNFTVAPLDDSFTPIADTKQTQKYRLAELGYHAVGESHSIPHELPLSLPRSLQAQASDLQMGREIALLLARTGKVYYAGNGARVGLQDTGCSWMELVLPEAIVSLSVGTDTETIVLRSGSGHVWIAGLGPETLGQGSPATGRFQRQEAGSTAAKLRKLQTANRRKCVAVSVSSGCIAYVTDNGKAYVYGRHAMQCHPETGHILGLDNVHLASIALGKTHAVAVTRHGHLYTWGLNNLNQCGRAESSGSLPRSGVAGDDMVRSSRAAQREESERTEFCAPTEHMWVKDFASICVKCGKCSARGDRCTSARISHENQAPKRGTLCACGEGETCCLRCGLCRTCGEESHDEASQSDGDRLGTPQRAMLPPARLLLHKTLPDIKISSVSCGNYHTIVLAADRQVFTFGSNCHGQLGVGHSKRCSGPQKVELPSNVHVVQVAAGANHSVLRTADGAIITFGAHRQGQLVREGDDRNWNALPAFVPGYGRASGIVATWIGASGDTTFIHSQKQIFSSDVISNCQIVSNKDAVIIFPNQVGKEYVAIRRKFGRFYQHSLGPAGLYMSWCLEPKYNLMWTFNAAEMRVQSLCDSVEHTEDMGTLLRSSNANSELIAKEISFLRAPEFTIPIEAESQLSTLQMAVNVLCTTYAITMLGTAMPNDGKRNELERRASMMAVGNGCGFVNGYVRVNRFDGYGGGWGYSAHSVEAIQFRASRDIRLLGIGLFGGRGEYIAKLKLFRLVGAEFDEKSVELVAESDEMLYECAPREKAHLMFPRAVIANANHWHIICAQVNGPSSDCGASGRANIIAEDGVQFFFRNSRMSNNGTDVNVGQIPELLYVSEVNAAPSASIANRDDGPEYVDASSCERISVAIRMQSLLSVTPATITSLFRILDWAIERAIIVEEGGDPESAWLRERATAVAIVALRMICFYVRCLYSTSTDGMNDDRKEPPSEFADLVIQFASIMNALFDLANERILSEDLTRWALLEEAVRTYVSCSRVLLPSSQLVVERLAMLMSTPNREWSLAALLTALCHQEYILPVLLCSERDGMPSTSLFPELVQKMTEQTQKKATNNRQRLTSLQNVLRFLFEIAFSQYNAEPRSSGARLKAAAHTLIVAIARELVTPKDSTLDGPPILQTPSRFRRTASHPNWDMSRGAADAIAIRVDVCGVMLHGIGVYCAHHGQQYNYVCEVLMNSGDAAHEQWTLLEKISGMLSANQFEVSQREIAMLRLTKAIRLQSGVVYAIRLTVEGGKTFCGEGGVGTVRLCNGARMHFQPCSLSQNGTSLARGQIPFVLYSMKENEVDIMQQIADYEQLSKWFLLLVRMLAAKLSDLIAAGSLGSSDRTLCSNIAGFVMVFLESNPRRALDIVSTLDDLLPMVSSANGEKLAEERGQSITRSMNVSEGPRNAQVIVECQHPYTPCSIHSQVVAFDKSVQFMSLQFNEECRTAQADDILWVYVGVDHECYVPIGRYFGDRDWPDRMLLVPGNSLWFVLETSTGSEDIMQEQMYGYRCTVTGYVNTEKDSNLILEQELTWICASACRLLVQIPSDPSVLNSISMVEEEMHDIVQKHGSLLRRGLNLSHVPTVNEVLKRSLPPTPLTPDLKFLREFVAGSSSTVAGFLARWMMNEPVVDVHSSQLYMPDEETRVGIPSQISLVPREQYGRLALCAAMNVEVTVRNGVASEHSSATFGSQLNKNAPTGTPNTLPTLQQLLQEPYRPVYMNKARYVAITMMTVYSKYSMEELRLAYFRDAILKENIKMIQRPDGSFTGEWTPKQSGAYRIECRLDGFQLAQSYVIEVRDDSEIRAAHLRRSDTQLRPNKRRVAHLSRARFAVCDHRVMSKGVRIRATPALNALQIGVIPRGCTVSYLEEVENSDGIWLRLTDETTAMHCETQFQTQAWCLQYSKHLDRHFLSLLSDDAAESNESDRNSLPLSIAIGPISSMKSNIKNHQNIVAGEQLDGQSILMDADETYVVQNGHSIVLHESPSLEAVSAEMIDSAVEPEVKTDGWLHNRHGVWVRLPQHQYKFALAQDLSGNCLLRRKSSLNHRYSNGNSGEGSPNGHRPVAQIPPRSRNEQPVKALRPSVADCCRTVFAAFLWHERLVKDAMACSTYLKFHPELHRMLFGQDRMDLIAPTPLYPLTQLWQEINNTVQTSIEQHLILPSPPAVRQFNLRPISDNINSAHQASASHKEDLCELCEEWHPSPVTTHMRMAHAGCGNHSGGHGYNSSGKYTAGWSGNCGDGGRPSAAWYLMCATCRSKHLKQTPSGHQQERNRRWREFRMSAAASDMSPETVIKQNAMFLLELNSSVEGDSKDTSTSTSGWTINLFPQATVTPPTLRSACAQAGNGLSSHVFSGTDRNSRSFMRTLSHASDPGPKQSAVHLAVTAGNSLASNTKVGSSPSTCGTHPPNTTGDFATALRRRMTDGHERRQSAEIVHSPSAALKSLLHNSQQASAHGSSHSPAAISVSRRRPVLAFVTERHDLGSIREAMATAIARATFFSHSFRVWNWLLKLVSAESSVSDILWQYLTTLGSYAPLCKWRSDDVRLATSLRLLPHPWRVCFLAGPVAAKMVQQMHSFLYTIAVILQSNGVDPSLRCLCFRTWTFQLTAHEQDLLILICNVLATVGGVLSDPSSDQSWNLDDSEGKANSRSILGGRQNDDRHHPDVREMDDITPLTRFEASSRQAMVVCLTDGNSDTFWESGEEDKNRPRTLTVHCDNECVNATLLTAYVDNIRDEGYRTCSLTVAATDSDGIRRILHSESLDHQYIGWVKCCIAGVSCVQVIFKSNDASVRVRQVRVFGFNMGTGLLGSPEDHKRSPLRPSPSHQLLFTTTQVDAFALFQAIAAQAFSDEFSHEENGTLREQVLELLFSRVQLQPLQTYVCSQMVNALEREVASLREKTKRNYSYACGLMVMLVKICGSRQGLEVFSMRNNLLITLSELLLFAPQVVQCQVVETIERLSRLFSPASLDSSKFIHNLLAVIAKVISLQVRDKTTHSLMSATLSSQATDAPPHWRIDRQISMDIGRLAKQFLSDVSHGSINEQWTLSVRTELANQVMNLARLNAGESASSERIAAATEVSTESGTLCTSRLSILKSGKFWLSVAALALLKEARWLELSTMWQSLQANRDREPEPLCDNHDDGRTLAQIYCEVCKCALCRDCFTVLHLNKRNRSHEVQVVGSASGCPQVDIHEGCTRFRLSNLLVLFHSSTLNGMVEFSVGDSKGLFPVNVSSSRNFLSSQSSSPYQTPTNVATRCRFCANQLRNDIQLIGGVCEHEECVQLASSACAKMLSCGHLCGGIADENVCMPCLNCHRPEARQDADDLCVICFTDRLGGAPCVQLACGHIFHYRCVKIILEKRWNGPRIIFRFMQCPLCKQQIEHTALNELLIPLKALRDDVASKARLRLEYDGLLQCPAVTSENSEFYGDPEGYAMDRYMYVLCFKCGKAYFGGESRCQQALDNSQYNPEELLCGGCSDVVGAQVCGRHGVDYLEYKCRFCCSVAVYFCFGTTHFCAACHDDFQRLMCLPKQLLPKCPAGPKGVQLEGDGCPLRMQHPPTGEEFAMGCGICRNLSTF